MQAIACGTAYFDGTTQLYSKANYAHTHQSSHSINFQNAIDFFFLTQKLHHYAVEIDHGKIKEIYQ